MSTDLVTKKLTPLDAALRPVLNSSPNIVKLLPPGMSLERFMMQVRLALVKNPALQSCTPSSLIGAVLEAADLGLDPSGRLGSAYLIPFKGVVTLVPGYRGLIDLAGRSGLVRSLNAFAVHAKDSFSVRLGSTPMHVPYIPMLDSPQDPGPWYAVWARARMAGGVTESEMMTHAEVMKIKARSPGASSDRSPWKSDEEEMAKKTVIRRLVKKLPLSPTANWDKLSRALDMGDGAVIEGEARNMTSLFESEDGGLDEGEPAPQSKADELKAKL